MKFSNAEMLEKARTQQLTFATTGAGAGSDEIEVGPAHRRGRHKSILTTAIYSHPTDEDLLRAVSGIPCC